MNPSFYLQELAGRPYTIDFDEASHKHSFDIKNKSAMEINTTKYMKPLMHTASKMKATGVGHPDHSKWEEARKVIAPYVNMMKKGHTMNLRKQTDRYGFFLTKKSSVLMKNLTSFIEHKQDLPGLLYETVDVLKGLTESLGARLYLVDKTANMLYQYQKNVTYPRCRVNYIIEPGTFVASYVAYTKEYVCSEDITRDARFSEGVSYKDNVKAVLSVPIVTGEEAYAVIELFRDITREPYSKEDLKIVVLVSGWIGLAIQQNKEGVMLHQKQEINDDLLQLVLAYFGKSLSLEQLLGDILSYTKIKLNAEKGIIYVIARDKEELMANVYEEGITEDVSALIKKKISVKFGKDKSVPSMVAKSGEMMNVKDVHKDQRFDMEVEAGENFDIIHRSELCMPVKSREGMIGIISIINKKDGGYFMQDDEEMLAIVTTYTCMALHYANVVEKNNTSELKLLEAEDLLKFHLKPCQHKLDAFEEDVLIPRNIQEYSWYILPEDMVIMPQLFIHMMKEVIGEEYLNFDELKDFILTVQQGYRDNPYHNFEHAFNVAHCMYTLLIRNKDKFALHERQGLMAAAICHDIDHAGTTNNFLVVSHHNLSKLYDESQWENHHIYVTMQILAKYNIYNNVDSMIYSMILQDIKQNILATDLVYYFKTRTKLVPLIQQNSFSFQNQLHKSYLRNIMMTMCDLSHSAKPFSISKRITDGLYTEFYRQGDLEKSMGVIPLAMMDRDNQHQVPEDQVQFISILVITCAGLLQQILINTEELYENTSLSRDTWKRIIDSRGEKIWRQCDSEV